MKRIAGVLNKILLLTMTLLWGIISINTIRNLSYAVAHEYATDFYSYLFLMGIAIVLILMLLVYGIKTEKYKNKRIWVVLGIIIVTMQLLFSYNMKLTPLWDSLSVVTEAKRMVGDVRAYMSSQDGYFEMYGNNYFIVLALYFFYSLLSIFQIEHTWMFSVLLNIILIDLAIVCSCLLLYKVRGEKSAFICLIWWVFNPYSYIYVTYVYTTTFSMVSVVSQIYIAYLIYTAIKNNQKKKIAIYSILEGVVAALSFYLRATNFIIIIACVIASGLFVLYKFTFFKKIKRSTGLAMIIIVVVFAGTMFGYRQLENYYVKDAMREKNFPITHWIMMSHKYEGRGRFSDSDEQKTCSYETKEEKRKETLKELKHRIEYLVEEEVLLDHYNTKLKVLWSEGIDYTNNYLHANNAFGELYEWLAGKRGDLFAAYYQLFLSLMYVLALYGTIQQMKLKQINQIHQLLSIIIFGVCTFYLIWEVSYVYSICFIPIVSMLTTMGIDNVVERKDSYRVFGLIIPSLICLAVVVLNYPINQKMEITYDNYAILSHYRRPDLETEILKVKEEKIQLEQTFKIQEGKTYNKINFLVKSINDKKDCNYLVQLYKGEKMLYETMIADQNEINVEYYQHISLPEIYGAGKYKLLIKGIDSQWDDSIAFIMAKHEMYDNNPAGFLTIDGKKHEKKLDLVFNVWME